MFTRRDEPNRVASVRMGRFLSIGIYAYTVEEMGLPMVGMGNHLDVLEHITPERAEEIAAGLLQAAKRARGDVPSASPVPLNDNRATVRQ